jgi:hypothetical protein
VERGASKSGSRGKGHQDLQEQQFTKNNWGGLWILFPFHEPGADDALVEVLQGSFGVEIFAT